MDYGKIIRRAATIVWDSKFLMILGFLAALGGGNTLTFNANGGSGGEGFSSGGEGFYFGPFSGRFDVEPRISVMLLLALSVALLFGLLIFVVSNVARGGLITAVDRIEEDARSTMAETWRAGWERMPTLLGIGLVPAIPVFFLLFVGLLGFLGMAGIRGENVVAAPFGMPLSGLVAGLTCLMVPLSLILGLLRSFANRAAMLEGLGAIDAYGRGLSVLRGNAGEAILLFLLQIALSVALTLLLILPGIIAALCCFLWPLLFVFQGAMTAFFSALWTLAWREWTGSAGTVDQLKKVA